MVSNAADCYGRRGREAKVRRDVEALGRAGFTTAEVDLREHLAGGELGELLTGFDLVWVGGGNTFALVHLMHRSGFADVIDEVLNGGVIYAGESAGAVACAPSLAGVERHDDPSLSPDPTLPGLGLVPFLAWAHWDARHPDHVTRHGALPGVSTPMYRISDGEHLVVSGGSVALQDTRPAARDDRDAGLATLF